MSQLGTILKLLYPVGLEDANITRNNWATANQNFSALDRGLAFGCIHALENSSPTAIAVAGTPVQIEIFAVNGPKRNTTPDHTENHILIDEKGCYLVLAFGSIDSVIGAGSIVTIEIKKNDGNTLIAPHVHHTISGGGGSSVGFAAGNLVTLEKNETVEAWIVNESNTQNYVVESIALLAIRIGVAE